MLSNKPSTSTNEAAFGNVPLSMFVEAAALPSTDADSIDSGEYEEIGAEKPSSTIGRVHSDCFPHFKCKIVVAATNSRA